MYKGSAYSGYPFLMLSDPYLPNGSMSPLVSSSSLYGEVLWPLSLVKYVAGIVQAPTHAYFLTNWSPVSEIAGHCSVQAKRKSSGKGERCSAGSARFALSLLEELLFQSPHPLGLALLFQQSDPNISWKSVCSFFWVAGFGGSSSWSLCLRSGICPAAELVC